MDINKRAYVGNRFSLELEKRTSGWLFNADGGQAATDTISERIAGGHPVRKHPGVVKVEDISVSCGTGMSSQFYDWLKKSLEYDHQRHDGAIITCNYDYKEVVRQTFRQALITEIGFPGLDAASKDACRFNIKFGPEETLVEYGSGKTAGMGDTQQAKQKLWTSSNFRMQIDGFDCRRVSKVEAINIKQNIVENAIGERLIYEKEPAQIDFPNLVISIPEIDIAPWYKWHESFVIRGQSAPKNEKGGSLTFLANDVKTELFSLDFTNLGIIKFTPDKLDSAQEKLRMVKVEMYCESMKFKYNSVSTWQ